MGTGTGMQQQSVTAASVPVEKVDTGSSTLNKEINNFYKCVSDTHKDPPSLSTTDNCFTSNVDSGGSNGFIHEFVPGAIIIPHIHTEIIHSFNQQHHFFIFRHHFGDRHDFFH